MSYLADTQKNATNLTGDQQNNLLKLSFPNQWISEQTRLARPTYLILNSDGEQENLQALLTQQPTPEHINVYSQTPISSMAAGPFIFKISSTIRPLLTSLLATPECNWGWLVSCKGDQIAAMADHWRARIIIGQRPEQSLYRFHDNRVIARALNHLELESLPQYLGPIAGLCYWNGQDWAAAENPSPGIYPVPANPAWLTVPVPAKSLRAVLRHNIELYLRGKHALETYELEQSMPVSDWLDIQLDMAEQWGWAAPEKLLFLITQRLKEEKGKIIQDWLPLQGEAPQLHFDRLYKEAEYWCDEKLQ